MNSGNEFEDQENRHLEVICGVVLLAFSALLGIGAVALPVASHWNTGALIAALVAVLIAWGLGVLGIRLVLGQGRVKKDLFSPTGLLIGAGLFTIAGAGVVIVGLLDKKLQALPAGLGSFFIAYYAWRIAEKRRRSLRDA